MTLEELQAKREQILKTLGIYRATFGDRSVEYSDAQKALNVIDNEIAAADPAGVSNSRTTYGSFRKGIRS
jgi:hypothetical protein